MRVLHLILTLFKMKMTITNYNNALAKDKNGQRGPSQM